MDATWYSTLAPEEKLRLAPSYVNLLLEQLASAHRRQERLIKVADRYNNLKLANRKGLCCKNCFEMENVKLVLRCRSCSVWGCKKCNTKEKRVVKCGGCGYTTCERCDPSVVNYDPDPLLWQCFACDIAAAVTEECNDKLELLHNGKITRSEAVVIWMDDTENETVLKPTCYALKTRLEDRWSIFKGKEFVLDLDFPEIESCTLVIIPNFDQSPISVGLAKEIMSLFFPSDDTDSWKNTLENMSFDRSDASRITYTVGEFIDTWVDDGVITEEQALLATPKLRDSIFN